MSLKAKLMLVATATSVLIGCTTDRSPSQVYHEYNSKVIDGITFDEEKTYYSKRKLQEIESKMPQYMAQMEMSREEVIKNSLKLYRDVVRCKEIKLIKETISGEVSILEYAQRDICGNTSTIQENQVVRMVKENGWKLDNVEIYL